MMVGGTIGIYMHLRINFQFEVELQPGLSILDLALAALSGAIPALAPGALLIISAMGKLNILIFQYKNSA